MSRRIRFVLLAALVGIGGAAWQWFHRSSRAGTDITGSGIIEITEVDVAFEVPGTIVERRVDEGAWLDKGEPIARLDDREYRLHVDRATAAKAAANARYQLVLTGPRAQDIDQALAAVEAADSDLATQQRDFERIKSLFDRRVVSQSEFDRANFSMTAARANRDKAHAVLDMLKEGSRTEEIEEARARLREADKALDLAELNLARCQLFAPIAGWVLSKNREAGEMVPTGASIVTLGDLTRPWLNLYIGERDLGRITLGMPAQVTVDSFPNQPFAGTVSFIAERAEFTPKNIQTPDERVKLVYRVKIALENPRQTLKPGMPADGVIPLNHRTP